MSDPRALITARNNADWYQAMFELHGLRYRRTGLGFWAVDPPPPYHSHLVTLDPDPSPELLELITVESIRPGFGLKDSFTALDLDWLGLVEHVTATWVWADDPPGNDTAGWSRLTSGEELVRWERAWKAGGSPSGRRQFPEAILDRPDVTIWGRSSGDGFDAGAIANRSEDCVGMSNVFGHAAIDAAATLCAELGAGLPVVGYEHGDALDEAMAAGFEPVGALRICGRPG